MIVRAKRPTPDLVEVKIQQEEKRAIGGKIRMSETQSEKLREFAYRHQVSQQAIIETAVMQFIETYD